MKLINISCCFKFNKDTNLIKYFKNVYINITIYISAIEQCSEQNTSKSKERMHSNIN